MPTPSKSLIVVAAALATLAVVYILAAVSLNFFPFSAPTTEDSQTVEPLVDVLSSNLQQDAGPGTGVEVSPLPTNAPTSPVTPQIPPNTDVGSGAGGGGQTTPVPPEQGNQTPDVQPTLTPPTPEGDVQSTAVPPEQNVESQPIPGPSPTPIIQGGGGGGAASASDDDDGGTPTNQSPTALDDSATVNEGGSVVIAVLSKTVTRTVTLSPSLE